MPAALPAAAAALTLRREAWGHGLRRLLHASAGIGQPVARLTLAPGARAFGFDASQLLSDLHELRGAEPGSTLELTDILGLEWAASLPEELVALTLPLECLTFTSRLNYLKWIAPGDGVSYGHTWIAQRPTFLGTMALGYGDGYLRLFSNRGRVWVEGAEAPIVGRVCMDQSMIDLTDHPRRESLREGDLVTVFAPGPASQPGTWAWGHTVPGTSAGALVGGMGRRVQRHVH